MNEEAKRSPRSEHFRLAIAAFIEARREAKLKGKEGDTSTAAKYDYVTWLSSAADRARHLQSVTHVLKATHPSAKGSNAYVPPSIMIDRTEIGTYSVGNRFEEDTAVADAKHLDVFSFLKQSFDGRRILDWIRDDDPDLHMALHSDPGIALAWATAFKNLIRVDERPVSNSLAKQIYWLTGNDPTNDTDYHLLQPMFSSSLAHAVHADIQNARFGEANKLARQSFRSKEAHDRPYHDYRKLVVRKLGGTKPQNISQLNSERGGVNYLLASLPPTRMHERPPSLLRLESVMDRLAFFKGTGRLAKTLADFLLSDPPRNEKTRTTRKAIEQELGAQLALFAVEIHARLTPGWTRDPDCALALCEQLWLDPERTELPIRDDPEHPEWSELDREFNIAYVCGDWPDEVAGRFANWVNEQLRKAGLTMVGDAEYKHWTRQAIIDVAWPIPMQRRTPAEGDA
jgi:CRISPR-associated protein Csy1